MAWRPASWLATRHGVVNRPEASRTVPRTVHVFPASPFVSRLAHNLPEESALWGLLSRKRSTSSGERVLERYHAIDEGHIEQELTHVPASGERVVVRRTFMRAA